MIGLFTKSVLKIVFERKIDCSKICVLKPLLWQQLVQYLRGKILFLLQIYRKEKFYSAFRIFSQILFDFKNSISGPIELNFSGKTLYAILLPQISSLVGLFLKYRRNSSGFLVRFHGNVSYTTRFSQTLFDYNILVSCSIFPKFSGLTPEAIFLPQFSFRVVIFSLRPELRFCVRFPDLLKPV